MKTINKTIKMKTNKIILVLLLAVTPFVSFSQSLFEKYEDLDEVTTMVVTKSAFRLLGKIGVENSDKGMIDANDVQNLDNLAVYTTDDPSIAARMKADVKKYLKTATLSELFRVKDKDGNVKIYVKEGRDDKHVKELFMIIEGIKHVNLDGRKPNIVIMTLTGDIDLEKVGKVINKMNVPGGHHINEATHK